VRQPSKLAAAGIAALIAGAAAAPAAHAGTASIVSYTRYVPELDRSLTSSALAYRAAPGERNRVRIDFRSVDRVRDAAGVVPGRGCRRLSATQAACDEGGPPQDLPIAAEISLGGGDDTLVLGGHPLSDGGIVVSDGPGRDFVDARTSAGTTFLGGAGPDRYLGSPHPDLFAAFALPDGPDRFDGRGGRDSADYGGLRVPVTVTLGGAAGDGPRGDGDRLAHVEHATGGHAADVLIGNRAANALAGGGGADVLVGGGGDDLLVGGAGPDRLRAGSGSDTAYGGPGADRIDGGAGVDEVLGGPGADLVLGRDGREETVLCDDYASAAPGDRALLDAADTALGCERVERSGPPWATVVFGATEATDLVQSLDSRRAPVLVPLLCPRGAGRCRGTVVLRQEGRPITHAAGRLAAGPLVGAARFSRPAGRTTIVRVRLNATGWRRYTRAAADPVGQLPLSLTLRTADRRGAAHVRRFAMALE
jgi:RTX calcium-binding nonapeptide repeat (4 copies)